MNKEANKQMSNKQINSKFKIARLRRGILKQSLIISNSKLFFIFIYLFAYLVICLFSYSVKVQAQEVGRTLTVVPPLQDFKAKPGEQIQTNIKVKNESDEIIYIKGGVKDFIVTDDIGTPTMVEEKVSGRWSLSSWLVLSPTENTIPPHSFKSFDLVIIIPEDALPGGHYASVYFTPTTDGFKNQSGSGIETRIASLVNLVVLGSTTEQAYVRKFWAPGYSEYGPVQITSQIENQGNTHIIPSGKIEVTDLLGRTLGTYPIEERKIFPFAVRTYENSFGKKWLFGRYKATLTAAYGQTGQVLTANLFFWVFPWRIILTVILVLTTLLFMVYSFRHKKKQKETQV